MRDVEGSPYSDYISMLLPGTPFAEPFLHLLFNMPIPHLNLPLLYAQPANQKDFTDAPLPSPLAFLLRQRTMMRENMTPIGRLQEATQEGELKGKN